jgi:peptide/nickel transport system substrate-binding protein
MDPENKNNDNLTPSNPAQSEQVPSEPNQPPQTGFYPSTAPQQSKKKRSKKYVLMILALLIIGAGAAAFLLNRDEPQSNQAQTTKREIAQLNIGLVETDLTDINVNQEIASYDFMVNSQIFEGLVRYESKNKIVPLLATNWSNPDAKTWVFNLKQGVKFHSGGNFTAKDVKAAIDGLKSQDTDYSAIFTANIDTVTVNNDYQVTLTTKEPDAVLLNKLNSIYITEALAPKDRETTLAGTGPYVAKPGTKPSSNEINLVAYDGYHGERPLTRAVNFLTAKTTQELLDGVKNGKFNIVGTVTDKEAQGTQAFKYIVNEPEVGFFGINTTKGPLAKKEVRQALRHGIDTQKLGETLGNKVNLKSQLIPNEIPGHNPEIQPAAYDPAKAKQLLAKAGYPNGLTINFSTGDTNPALAQETTRQLKEIGVTVKTKSYNDFNTYVDEVFGGNTEMYYLVYISDILDGVDILTTIFQDSANYKNPKVDQLVEEASGTIDAQKRLNLLQEASKIIDDDAAIIPTYSKDLIWLMDKDYQITQDMPSTFLSAYLAKVYEQ